MLNILKKILGIIIILSVFMLLLTGIFYCTNNGNITISECIFGAFLTLSACIGIIGLITLGFILLEN